MILQRVDSTIDFSWGSGSPDPLIDNDTFFIRWAGWLEAPTDGTYTIYTDSDDGIRVQVDGEMLIDNWTNHGTTENSGTVYLKAGVKVPVYVRYYENTGGATLRLKWSGPGISKQIIPSNNLWGDALPQDQETRYVYDGWNIIAELDATKVQSNFAGAVTQRHVWGLDVSGGLHDTGGIGALLMTRDGSSDYFAIYDGRGNLSGMMNSNGSVVAGWEYNAFGEPVKSVGSKKDDFHFGWATKFTEPTLRLINFGKRFYDVRHGRFINRDPIGENGGVNLYAFLNNNPLGGYEYLGMSFFSKLWKSIKGFVKGVWNAFKDVVIQTVLAFIPVVGVFLAAAYGAYRGYKEGGVLGGVFGFMSGFKVGFDAKSAGKGLKSALKSAWNDMIEGVTLQSYISYEIQSQVMRAAERRIRGFSKWMGRIGNALGIVSGWSEFKASFREQMAVTVDSLRLSDQAKSAEAPGLDNGNIEFGPMEWEVDGVWYSEETWKGRYESIQDFSPLPTGSGVLKGPGGFELCYDCHPDKNYSFPPIEVAIADAASGVSEALATMAAATEIGRGGPLGMVTSAATVVVGVGGLAVTSCTGVGAYASSLVVAKGVIDFHLSLAATIDKFQTGGKRNVPTSFFQAVGRGINGEEGEKYGSVLDLGTSAFAPPKWGIAVDGASQVLDHFDQEE